MAAPEETGPWWVYVLRCGNGALYTGITTDVARRLGEHRQGNGRGAKSLRGRGPLELVARRKVGTRSLALEIEREIKRRPKQEKETLVRSARALRELVAGKRRDG